MEEIWKDVPNYEGLYQVSNLGNVKSLNYNGNKIVKILKLTLGVRGYYEVRLGKNSKYKTFNVHQLVAITFLNHIPCGYKLVVDHINDIKTDNRVENLQIITQRENVFKTQGNYTSKYKGVSWHKERNKWGASIYKNGKSKNLGRFKCELEAAQAYQKALNEL